MNVRLFIPLAIALLQPVCAIAIENGTAKIYTTSKAEGKYIDCSVSAPFSKYGQPLEGDAHIFIDLKHRFEKFIGFGGAITDASAEVYAKLPGEKQKEFIDAYYDDEKGIGYNLVRTHMNSCDFSSDNYIYIEEGDNSLESFDVSHDEKYRIPLIKEVMRKVGDDFLLFFAPWSPPAWMKTNKSMLAGGHLLKEYYPVWAEYYVRFIQEYEKRNIPIWGLSIQNESMAATAWEACQYDADEARVFLKDYLGPALHRAGMGDKKIMIWDHNRDLIYQYVSVIMNDPEAAKYVWGAGVHWYENWAGEPLYDNVQLTKAAFPDLNLIFTEGCLAFFDKDKLYDVSRGEHYATNILNDLRSGVMGWTDWNILLDMTGGPNHLNNYCFAPVHADVETGELHYTYAYWYIGHFSKFIKPGAVRVAASSNRSQLETVAYLNPDNTLVVVVLNRTGKDIKYGMWMDGYNSPAIIKAHTIETWVI